MERKYTAFLNSWLTDDSRKPLMVWGARQVGKSYLIKDIFAESKFKGNYIYVDCRTDYRFTDYCTTHVNAADVINYLSLTNDRVIDRNTLLVFDEAQECLPIITLMKYFCQEFREIPIIVTGSMVRIKIQRTTSKRGLGSNQQFLFPVGKIDQLTIYPMNFDEFLLNSNRQLYDRVVESYTNRTALDELSHTMAINMFYDYLLVGGMPEAVDTFLKTKNYQKSRNVLKNLYDNYLADMELYQASRESIVRSRAIFQDIYSQLNKETKNFKYSVVEKNASARVMKSPIDWLNLACVIEKSVMVKERVTSPLLESNESLFRLYLSDIGMFSYQSGINASTFIDKNTRNTLSGIFFENYVAIELVNAGQKLFYWKGKRNAEFEFLIDRNSTIIPINVKKSRGSLNSADEFRNHNQTNTIVKVSSNYYGYDEHTKILTLPFYDVFLFCKSLTEFR